jgi:hypothetical protein
MQRCGQPRFCSKHSFVSKLQHSTARTAEGGEQLSAPRLKTPRHDTLWTPPIHVARQQPTVTVTNATNSFNGRTDSGKHQDVQRSNNKLPTFPRCLCFELQKTSNCQYTNTHTHTHTHTRVNSHNLVCSVRARDGHTHTCTAVSTILENTK